MQEPIDEHLHQISLPEGLQELMSDITREVLRAQPQNVFSFISNYLAALLEIRNNISIAVDLCSDIDKFSSHTTLVAELTDIGLTEEDLVKATDAIIECLGKNKVKEANLFLQLLKKTNIDEGQLQEVHRAVHQVFKKHRLSPSLITSQRIIVYENASSLASLAGSYVTLPQHRPYAAHDDFSDKSERNTDATDINTDDEVESDASSFRIG